VIAVIDVADGEEGFEEGGGFGGRTTNPQPRPIRKANTTCCLFESCPSVSMKLMSKSGRQDLGSSPEDVCTPW
jgi:hypothetical protein